MAGRYELDTEVVQLGNGSSLLAYERDGLIHNKAPIEEYLRFTASGLAGGQTAVFDLNQYGMDLMPGFLYADFVATAGNVTLSILYYGAVIATYSINGGSAEAGYDIPKIPVSHENTQIRVLTAQPCNFIWISFQQVKVLANIAQDFFI